MVRCARGAVLASGLTSSQSGRSTKAGYATSGAAVTCCFRCGLACHSIKPGQVVSASAAASFARFLAADSRQGRVLSDT